MTWDESEHPRDELGKFTYKGGGDDDKEENKENKKNSQERKKESNKQYNFDTPFKLNAEYTETRGQTPAEILLGTSTTNKQEKTQERINGLSCRNLSCVFICI